MARGAWTMGDDDDKEEGKEETDSDAEPERLQYKVKKQTLPTRADRSCCFVVSLKIISTE